MHEAEESEFSKNINHDYQLTLALVRGEWNRNA
jgi:hypothetical protein